MKKRNVAAVAVTLLAVSIGALYLWTRPAPLAPTAGPPPAATADDLAAGARVVALGDCMVCHTAKGGAAYAGGLGLGTPFGTIYSTNITPDAQTGIGSWSEEAFRRALREGVARDGHLLYPAFPYVHYTRMTDADIGLAYRYLMSRTPVHAEPPHNALLFPLNFRPVLAFWNALYLRPGADAAPVPPNDPVLRGRYLVDTLGHCASCHSGMNLLGGERRPAFQGGNIDGWDAPALTGLAGSAAPWRQQELVEYLRGGLSAAHGAAKGPMRPVTEHLASVPREDVEAIAAYLMSIQTPPAAPSAAPASAAATAAPSAQRIAADAPGARLFAAACAGCHTDTAPMMRIGGRPGLALSSAVLGGKPDNFVQTVLHGVPWEAASAVYMPPFADVLSDEQVGQLAAYIRTDIAARPAWSDVAKTSAKLRKETQQ